MKKTILPICTFFLVLSCDKDKNDPYADLKFENVVTEVSENVTAATYNDLSLKSDALYNALVSFTQNPTEEGLTTCKNLWKEARGAWEMSEGFLYGPVATDNIDPRIDSWPIDFNGVETVLNGTLDLSNQENINALDEALKGFHPIEYILWGTDGNKTIAQFTAREKEYLVALGLNLKSLTTYLSDSWNKNMSSTFYHQFINPSLTNDYYESYRMVSEQMVQAMIDICEEVADGKIGEPFTLQDASLEESPYSSNSITDFTNNMKSIQNVYLGKYSTDGKGMEDFVRKYNLSLDSKIKNHINAAIASLGNVTQPFGQAIFTQQVQVQNAIEAIENLKTVLEEELLPFVQQHVTN